MSIVAGAIKFSAIDGDEYADIHQIRAFEGEIVLFVNNIIAKHVLWLQRWADPQNGSIVYQ